MTKGLVSVVIPTHNRKTSALRLVRGLLKNDYKNIEIIVIDDLSNDGTSEYLKKNVRDKRLKIYRNKSNVFAAQSKNIGAKKAYGEYIFFVDDDNAVDKTLISSLVKVIDRKSTR